MLTALPRIVDAQQVVYTPYCCEHGFLGLCPNIVFRQVELSEPSSSNKQKTSGTVFLSLPSLQKLVGEVILAFVGNLGWNFWRALFILGPAKEGPKKISKLSEHFL